MTQTVEMKNDDAKTECETPVSSPERSPIKSEDQDSADFSKWPKVDIKEPGPNDVLYGRGGGTNHHDGNKRYRKMVELRKEDYINSKRLDKPLVALDIIRQWRTQKPPGRFLKLMDGTGLWHDVGDKKAREKTSQALREKAPLLRQQQKEILQEEAVEENKLGGKLKANGEQKNTRFGDLPSHTPRAKPNKNLARSGLMRLHSLGKDYVADGEPLSIEGFSWEEANGAAESKASKPLYPVHESPRRYSSYPHSTQPSSNYFGGYPDRAGSVPEEPRGSPVNRYHSAPIGPLTSPDPYSGPAPDRGMERQHSLAMNALPGASTSIPASKSFGAEEYPKTPAVSNEWSKSHSSAYHRSAAPHTDPGNIQAGWTKGINSYQNDERYQRQTRSAENNYRRSNDPYAQQRWDEGYRNGNHHQYPDPSGAPAPIPINQAYSDWASPPRSGSQDTRSFPPPYSSSSPYRSPHHPASLSSSDPYCNPGHQHTSNYGSNVQSHHRRSPSHSSDRSNGYGTESPPERSSSHAFGSPRGSVGSPDSPSHSIPRPHPIKRDTSHQCENDETKSRVKKMNRQRSIGNRQNYGVSDCAVKRLGRHLRQSSIGEIPMEDPTESPLSKIPRPESLGNKDRVNTMDLLKLYDDPSAPAEQMGYLVKELVSSDSTERLKEDAKPKSIKSSARGSSVGSLPLDDIASLVQVPPPSLGEGERIETFGELDRIDLADFDVPVTTV